MKPLLLFLSALPFIYCSQPEHNIRTVTDSSATVLLNKVMDIPLPDGFERIKAEPGSFAAHLQNIHLKKEKTVYLYNGERKKNQRAQFAVLDIPVGTQDLQQCADAVMRIRAEYLFAQKKFDSISFRDNNQKAYNFSRPYTKEHLNKYLLAVFANCGTASLSKQLKPVKNYNDIEPGDVLIKGGAPGHAVLVMDVAVNNDGKRAYLLAQSYMPAQDIHILLNPKYNLENPWYMVENEKIIYTPEWIFYSNQLMKW